MRNRPGNLFYLFLLSVFFLALTLPVYAQSYSFVVVIEVNGEINYGVQYLFEEGLSEAEKLDAPLLVIFDTPGGLLDASTNIIKIIRNSNVPVIGYVYPMGASAWSAGTLLLMATHIAAMAPGTQIGAVQPVFYNPATGEYKPINETKIINPLVEIITNLAKDRGRNVTAAEKFVKENLVLDDEEALKYHVIEVVATDINDLLDKIDGWKIKLDTGREYVLHTSGARVVKYSGSIRVYVIRAVSDPIINSLLSTIGVLTLIFSIISGHYLAVPLAIGLIILSLIGMGFSVNAISLALLFIGATALAIELFTPGFGILGFTGIILIAVSIALFPILNPEWMISPQYQATLFWSGVTLGVILGAFMGFILYKVVKIKRQPPKLKPIPENTIGRSADHIKPGKIGYVFVDGEYWRATSDEEILPGEKIMVIGREGTVLKVKKLETKENK